MSVYQSVLSETEREQLLAAILKNTEITPKCHIWKSKPDKCGYGRLYFTFRGVRKSFLVHRLKYFLENSGNFISPAEQVSHLCHNKLCVNPTHLSLEPDKINKRRNVCKNNGECEGHRGYRACIL